MADDSDTGAQEQKKKYGEKNIYHKKKISLQKNTMDLEASSSHRLTCVNFTNHSNDAFTPVRRENVQNMVDLPDSRQSDLLLAMTMYNETPTDLARSMKGIVENLQDLQSSGTVDSQRVTVVLVADGEDRVHEKTKLYLEKNGYFNSRDETYITGGLQNSAVVHFFCSTKTIPLNATNINPHGGSLDIRFVYCLKKKNAKKLDSHAWVIEGLAPIFCPAHVVFLDVGTRPQPNAIRMLISEMQHDPRVAGCCGEITIDQPYKRAFNKYLSPVILAQHFEYKMANSLDKSFESMFGFVAVLPGAFCAFKMGPWKSEHHHGGSTVMVDTGPLSDRPISQYFLPLTRKTQDGYDSLGSFNKNMYLAEDRVLCFELVAKKGEANILRYVKGSIAETDPMDSLAGLIAQRRRWLNGSLFAKIYAMKNFHQLLWNTNHSTSQLAAFTIQFAYYILQLVMDWFAVSLFFIQFRVATDLCLGDGSSQQNVQPLFGSDVNLQSVSWCLQFLYMFVIVLLLLISLSGARPNESVWSHRFAFLIFGLFSYGTIILTSAYIMLGGSLMLKILMLTSLSTYFVVGLIHGELHHVCLAILPYLFALPSFVNIFQIYSMSNLHDVSWGTRPEVPEDSIDSTTQNDSRRNYGAVHCVEHQQQNGMYQGLDDFMESLDEDIDEELAQGNCSCCCLCNNNKQRRRSHAPSTSIADIQQTNQRNFMLKTCGLWLISNLTLVLITTSAYEIVSEVEFMNVIMGLLFTSMILRMIGSTIYACQRYSRKRSPWCSSCRCSAA